MANLDNLPNQLRIPLIYVNWDPSQARGKLSPFKYRVTVIGQQLANTQVTGQPIRVVSSAQARHYFGAGAILTEMCQAVLTQHPFAKLWAIALSDPENATAAQSIITIEGQAEQDATIDLLIAGQAIQLTVRAGEIDTLLIERLQTLCHANDNLPVLAQIGNNPNQLQLIYKQPGEIGNSPTFVSLKQQQSELPTGLNIQYTPATGGSGNPDFSPVFANLDHGGAQLIVCPYLEHLALLTDTLNENQQSLAQQDILAFSAVNKGFGASMTLGESYNSAYLNLITTHASPTPAHCWAAAVAGVVSRYAEQDPARPFQTLPLKGILPPAETHQFSQQETNQLLFSGISTFSVNPSDTVQIQRLITTYKTNDYGAPDPSYLDLNTLLTLGYLRWDFRQHLMNKYARHKLANDDTQFRSGEPVLTPKVAKAEAIAKFREWEARGLVQDLAQFQEDLIVERHPNDPNRLTLILSPRLINQLRIIGVQLQFLL